MKLLWQIILIDWIIAKVNKPIIYVGTTGNYNAKTIPPFGILINNNNINNKKLLAHELYHWQQYQQTGAILFYLNYAFEMATLGYDTMPMEINARIAAGEFPHCINQYTQCVRNGTAATVANTNFRI